MKPTKKLFLRNAYIILAWWCLVMLIGIMALWGADFYQKHRLAEIINSILIVSGDPRQILTDTPNWGQTGRLLKGSKSYLMDEADSLVLVFSLHYGNLNASFAAVWRHGEGIEKTFPLYDQAKVVVDRLPDSIINWYRLKMASAETGAASPDSTL